MKKERLLLSLIMAGFVIGFTSCSDKNEDDLEKEITGGGSAVAVELGLSVKWASCNVGATSPEEYGDYFAWGETVPKGSYTESNSTTNGKSIEQLRSAGIIDSNNNLTAAYDAATVNMGSNYRMPTLEEQKELVEECTWTWTTQNGVYGWKVTGPNGNSIFLPAAGVRDEESFAHAGSLGFYWSATADSDIDFAYRINFGSGFYGCYDDGRIFGQSVRAVCE